jgi:ferredoxin
MADSSNKVEENVEGDYYVDTDCISCQLCVAVAPDFFEMGDVYAYVSQQPEDDAGIAMCEDALEQCPVDSIGNDG